MFGSNSTLTKTLLSTPGSLKQASPKNRINNITLKCVASNIRPYDLPWDSYSLSFGVGHEGNLVVVEVTTDTAFRTKVEDQFGHDVQLHTGDVFVGVLANRHSGTSESGDVPYGGIRIDQKTELYLLAAGGIVGVATGIPVSDKPPLRLKTLGLVTNPSDPIDLIDLCEGHNQHLNQSAPIILVSGTSAEVGKTTTSVSLINALKQAGLKVAGAKLSGTGRLRDIAKLREAGASPALDFPEAGLATTYTSAERFTSCMHSLFNRLNSAKPDVIVAEAGGDLIEANIPTFLADRDFMNSVKAAVVVSGDVMGMMGAVSYIRKFAQDLPVYLTDPKGRNPVTTRDRVSHELPGLTVFNSLSSEEVSIIANKIMRG